MDTDLLLYGSYGYTGRLIAERAVDHGLAPILAGRRAEPVERQARALDCPHRVFSLEHPSVVREHLNGVDAVLNCAGPYSATADPFVEACIDTGTDYLDISGEYEPIERIASRNENASQATVTLLPAVGFDVVPTDCLAAFLASELPSATELELAIEGAATLSKGTMKTLIEGLGADGAVRRNGKIETVPPASERRTVDFGSGPTSTVTIPWGDVATAYHTTGIPDIDVYAAVPERAISVMRRTRPLGPILQSGPVQRLLQRAVDALVTGPSADRRDQNRCRIWGSVSDAEGNRVIARMRTPDPYDLTVVTALRATERVLNGEVSPGFQTPAMAFGPDFALTVDGVERTVIDRFVD